MAGISTEPASIELLLGLKDGLQVRLGLKRGQGLNTCVVIGDGEYPRDGGIKWVIDLLSVATYI